jgi:hypothetical protein
MKWQEIRRQYPKQWLLVEAINAHSESNKRVLDQLSVIDTFQDSDNAMRSYQRIHKKFPKREMYVLHTDRERIDISERKWLGIRDIQLRSLLTLKRKEVKPPAVTTNPTIIQ